MSDEPVDLETLRTFVGEDAREVSASVALIGEGAGRASQEIRRTGRPALRSESDRVLAALVPLRSEPTAPAQAAR